MTYPQSPIHQVCLRPPCEQVSVQIPTCAMAYREPRRSRYRASGPWISSSQGALVGERHPSLSQPPHRLRFPPGWVGPLDLSRSMDYSSSCYCNEVAKQDRNRQRQPGDSTRHSSQNKTQVVQQEALQMRGVSCSCFAMAYL